MFSVWLCIPFAGCFTGYATAQLWQCYTCRPSCVPASLTSVGAHCRGQTDTSILSVEACHANSPGPSLAVPVQASTLISSWLCSSADDCMICVMVSFHLHPLCHQFQCRHLWSSSSLQPVIWRTGLSPSAVVHFQWLGSHLWNSLLCDVTSALTVRPDLE